MDKLPGLMNENALKTTEKYVIKIIVFSKNNAYPNDFFQERIDYDKPHNEIKQ